MVKIENTAVKRLERSAETLSNVAQLNFGRSFELNLANLVSESDSKKDSEGDSKNHTKNVAKSHSKTKTQDQSNYSARNCQCAAFASLHLHSQFEWRTSQRRLHRRNQLQLVIWTLIIRSEPFDHNQIA